MVKSNVREERTVSLPQRHRLLFSTSHPKSLPIADSPEEPRELSSRTQQKQMSDDTFAEHVSAKTLGLVNSILSPGDVTKLCSEKHLLLHWYLSLLALTCCWLPCRPAGPPAPVSPGAAGWGWSGSSFGLSDRVWLSLFARQSLRGSDPALKLLGWYETLGGSYWPWEDEIGGVGSGLVRLW